MGKAIPSSNWALCVGGSKLDDDIVWIEVEHPSAEVLLRARRGETPKANDGCFYRSRESLFDKLTGDFEQAPALEGIATDHTGAESDDPQ
jgi:hypothetical protein